MRKWSKEDAGIEDLDKIGLKRLAHGGEQGLRPDAAQPRRRDADGDRQPARRVAQLIQKIFTGHPTLEADLLMKELT